MQDVQTQNIPILNSPDQEKRDRQQDTETSAWVQTPSGAMRVATPKVFKGNVFMAVHNHYMALSDGDDEVFDFQKYKNADYQNPYLQEFIKNDINQYPAKKSLRFHSEPGDDGKFRMRNFLKELIELETVVDIAKLIAKYGLLKSENPNSQRMITVAICASTAYINSAGEVKPILEVSRDVKFLVLMAKNIQQQLTAEILNAYNGPVYIEVNLAAMKETIFTLVNKYYAEIYMKPQHDNHFYELSNKVEDYESFKNNIENRQKVVLIKGKISGTEGAGLTRMEEFLEGMGKAESIQEIAQLLLTSRGNNTRRILFSIMFLMLKNESNIAINIDGSVITDSNTEEAKLVLRATMRLAAELPNIEEAICNLANEYGIDNSVIAELQLTEAQKVFFLKPFAKESFNDATVDDMHITP